MQPLYRLATIKKGVIIFTNGLINAFCMLGNIVVHVMSVKHAKLWADCLLLCGLCVN
jgi:hypothetical protein